MKPTPDRDSLFFGVVFILIAGIVGIGGVLWKNFVEYTSNPSSRSEVLSDISVAPPFSGNPDRSDKIVFTFTVPNGDLVKFLEMVQPKLDRIIARTGKKALIDISKNELEVVNRVESDFADYGSLSALGYSHFCKSRKIKAILERFSEPPKCSLIIVRKKDPAREINDLKGYRMAYKHVYSLSGFILPEKMLKKRNINPNTFFKTRQFTDNYSNSLLGLQNKEFDCAAVSSNFFAEQSQDLQNQFKILYKSDPVPGGIYIVKSDKNKSYEKIVLKNFLDYSSQFKGTGPFSGLFKVMKPRIELLENLGNE